MARAEFEEKTYEKYFGWELIRHAKASYSPGQCGELLVGFDDAFWLIRVASLRFRHLFPGSWLPGLSVSEVNDLARTIGHELPPFRFNIFVQYKRPQQMVGNRSAEWRCWGRPYYRYHTTNHQQAALTTIHRASRGRAAVVYAAAAFVRNERLFECAQSRQVIDNSNIAAVERLVDHEVYTYDRSGNIGVAHSDPEEIDSPNFLEIVRNIPEQEGALFYDHVVATARIVRTSLEELQGHLDILDVSIRTNMILAGIDDGQLERDSFVDAIYTIEAFLDLYNTSLYMLA